MPSIGLIDADNGFGHSASYLACTKVIKLAKINGIGLVGIINSTHYGAAGAYSLEIANNNFIGFSFTHSDSFAIPFNGINKFHGSNPYSFSAPINKSKYLLVDFSSTSIMEYQMTLQHLDFLEHVLVGEVPIRFSQHQQRLYLDMDWNNDVNADEYIIIECYRKLDPTTYTDVYNDLYLKRYATALIKRQWGANLSKFNGVSMLGGVTMNGENIYSQAQEELQKLEEQIQLAFELPVNYMIG